MRDNSRVAHVQTSTKVHNNLDEDSIEEGQIQSQKTFNANPIEKVLPADLEQQVYCHFSDDKVQQCQTP